jgi:hypothetical protein
MIIIYTFGGDSYAFLCFLISIRPFSLSKPPFSPIELLLEPERPDQEEELLGDA